MKTLHKSLVVFIALLLATSAFATGCKDKSTSTTITSSVTALASDTTPIDASSTIPASTTECYGADAVAMMNKTFTINGITISPLEYNFYFANSYSEMQSYATAYGIYPLTEDGYLDLAAENTIAPDAGATYGDVLESTVLSGIQGTVYLLKYAEEHNLALSEETSTSISGALDAIETEAQTLGMTGDSYVKVYYGDIATLQGFNEVMQRYYLASMAMDDYINNFDFTGMDITVPVVRHVLFPTMDLTTGESLTDEEIAAAYQAAQDFMSGITSYEDMVMNGDAALTEGTASESTEYSVNQGEMVAEFENWSYDATREVGDTEIIETVYGYHVMYFVGTSEISDDDKTTLAYEAMQDEIMVAIQASEYQPV